MRTSRSAAKRRGAAASELALMLPLLGFLFVMTVDFARVYLCTQVLQASADAAATAASGTAKCPSTCSQQSVAQQAARQCAVSLDPPLQDNQVTVAANSTRVQVTVAYQLQLVTPIFGDGGKVALERSATQVLAPRPGE